MIEDHGEDFDEHNVATAFQELAKEKSNIGNEDVHSHETFLKLVGGLNCSFNEVLHVET